jgi:hypothetical protein
LQKLEHESNSLHTPFRTFSLLPERRGVDKRFFYVTHPARHRGGARLRAMRRGRSPRPESKRTGIHSLNKAGIIEYFAEEFNQIHRAGRREFNQ